MKVSNALFTAHCWGLCGEPRKAVIERRGAIQLKKRAVVVRRGPTTHLTYHINRPDFGKSLLRRRARGGGGRAAVTRFASFMPCRVTPFAPFMPCRVTPFAPFHAGGRLRCWRDIRCWLRRHDRSRHWRRCQRRGSRRLLWGARGDQRQSGRDDYRFR